MGVPVNLDEVSGASAPHLFAILWFIPDVQVDSHRLSSLPPLRITTNLGTSSSSKPNQRSSTDSYRSSGLDKGKGRADPAAYGSQSVPVSATTNGNDGRRKERYGLGSRPLFDSTKAEDLCGVDEGEFISRKTRG